MEKEITEYTEPKKKKTKEELLVWSEDLLRRAEQDSIELKEAIKNLEDMFPEVFK
jgi:hypothetical protein